MSRLETMLQHFEKAKDWSEPRIAEGIEKNRKTNVILEVTDENGQPATDVKVSYKLKRHAFLNGTHLFMLDELETPEKNAAFKEYFLNTFNHATLPFYWADQEPEPGKPRFEKGSPKIYRRPAIDLCIEFCEKHNITPRLHCLNYDQWTPVWVDPHNIPEIKRLLEKRFKEIAERYAEKIPGIEVINETLIGQVHNEIRHSTDFFWEDDLVTWTFETARKYFPHNELLINECTPFAWDVSRGIRSAYAQLIDASLRRGASIDAIALQYHMFHRLEDEEQYSLPYFDPKRLFDVMDFYHKTFKMPLQVCEITLPCYSGSAEDEELQAKLIENLYSVWFSHPAVEQILYWNILDGYAAFAPLGAMTEGENYYRSGVIRFDMTPKPGYHMLQELFKHRWHTEGCTTTNAQGQACFRGFKGDYEIVLEKNGHPAKYTCTTDGSLVKLTLA